MTPTLTLSFKMHLVRYTLLCSQRQPQQICTMQRNLQVHKLPEQQESVFTPWTAGYSHSQRVESPWHVYHNVYWDRCDYVLYILLCVHSCTCLSEFKVIYSFIYFLTEGFGASAGCWMLFFVFFMFGWSSYCIHVKHAFKSRECKKATKCKVSCIWSQKTLKNNKYKRTPSTKTMSKATWAFFFLLIFSADQDTTVLFLSM